jgi:hypothetical protein
VLEVLAYTVYIAELSGSAIVKGVRYVDEVRVERDWDGAVAMGCVDKKSTIISLVHDVCAGIRNAIYRQDEGGSKGVRIRTGHNR